MFRAFVLGIVDLLVVVGLFYVWSSRKNVAPPNVHQLLILVSKELNVLNLQF
jgi:hypothetical protein